MKIANLYNYLNGREFLLVNRPSLWEEIGQAISSINANNFLKTSGDKTKKGNPSVPLVIIGVEPDELIPLPKKRSMKSK